MYRGDTYSKKVARLHFWMRCRDYFGHEEFKTKTFMYLASEVGGDASVLCGLGVPEVNQIAVDIDGAALMRFRSKYPLVQTYRGDIGRAAQKNTRKIDVLFMDFCSNLSEPLMQIMQCAVSAMRDGTILAYGAQRGRETQRVTEEIEKTRDWFVAQARTNIEKYTGHRFSDDELRTDGRSATLYERIGVPMMINAYQVHRAPNWTKPNDVDGHVMPWVQRHTDIQMMRYGGKEVQLSDRERRLYDSPWDMSFRQLPVTRERLMNLASALSRAGFDSTKLLNLEKEDDEFIRTGRCNTRAIKNSDVHSRRGRGRENLLVD